MAVIRWHEGVECLRTTVLYPPEYSTGGVEYIPMPDVGGLITYNWRRGHGYLIVQDRLVAFPHGESESIEDELQHFCRDRIVRTFSGYEIR